MNEIFNTKLSDARKDRDERKRERKMSDIRHEVKNVEGRRLYWGRMSDAGAFRLSYTGDTNDTFFNEGRRSIGLEMLNDLMEAKPEAFAQMQQEHAAEKKIEENEDNKSV